MAMQEVVSAVRQYGGSSGRAEPAYRGEPAGTEMAVQEDDPPVKNKKKKSGPRGDAPDGPDESARIEGYGDDILRFVEPIAGVAFLEIRGNPGAGYFAVWTLSPALEQDDLLVNTASPYSGVCLIGLQGPVAALQMSATGSWDVRLVAPSELPTLSAEVAGNGDSVIFLQDDFEPLAAANILRVNAQSEGNITLWVYGEVTELLVNDLNWYSGAVVIPAGGQYLVLTCEGPWSLSPE